MVNLDDFKKNFVIRKKCDDGDNVGWMSMKWLNVSKTYPYQLKTKQTLCAEVGFRTVSFARKGRNFALQPLRPLYSGKRCINPAKVADLRKLLPFIPPIFHPFYLSIKGDDKDKTVIVADPDGNESTDNDLDA